VGRLARNPQQASGGTTIGALKLDDFVNVLTTVDPGVLNRPCAWWVHPQNLARLVTVKDGNGRSIFLTAMEAPTPTGIGSILGYPVHLVHAAPSANTAGAKIAVFGDPQAALVGVRSDFSFEASDEYLWNTYQRSFRGVGRAGVVIRKASGLAALTLASS
jgi:HK97 family phage major capsid protein